MKINFFTIIAVSGLLGTIVLLAGAIQPPMTSGPVPEENYFRMAFAMVPFFTAMFIVIMFGMRR